MDDDDGSDDGNNNNDPNDNGRGNNNPPLPPPPPPVNPAANNNAGAGDSNDPPPPGDGADIDNEDSDDKADEEGFYSHAVIDLPLGYTLNNFDYNNVCRLVCQVFHLCGISDQYHGSMMVFGVITTFAKLATFQQSTWPAVQQAALKWHPSKCSLAYI